MRLMRKVTLQMLLEVRREETTMGASACCGDSGLDFLRGEALLVHSHGSPSLQEDDCHAKIRKDRVASGAKRRQNMERFGWLGV